MIEIDDDQPWDDASHICLVSDQLLPNLIPVLMLRPRCVHLVVTPSMKSKARRFERLVKERGIRVESHHDAPSSGMPNLMHFAEELAVILSGTGPFILNVTGGTKPMALALQQVLPELLEDVEVVYTDTQSGQIEVLSPRGRAPLPIESVVDLELYLRAQGLTARKAASDNPAWLTRVEQLRPLTYWLARHAPRIEGFIGALNAAAERALAGWPESFRAEQTLESRSKLAREALQKLASDDFGLIRSISEKTVRFEGEDAARYLGGIWLEHYAWLRLRDLGASDVRCGLDVAWQERSGGKGALNELDVVAVKNNRLLLIECKTARLDRDWLKDQQILNKLESLGRNAGGLFGEAILLSARRLNDEMRARASAYRLATFDCSDLKEFDSYLITWLSSESGGTG